MIQNHFFLLRHYKTPLKFLCLIHYENQSSWSYSWKQWKSRNFKGSVLRLQNASLAYQNNKKLNFLAWQHMVRKLLKFFSVSVKQFINNFTSKVLNEHSLHASSYVHHDCLPHAGGVSHWCVDSWTCQLHFFNVKASILLYKLHHLLKRWYIHWQVKRVHLSFAYLPLRAADISKYIFVICATPHIINMMAELLEKTSHGGT